MFDRRVLDFLSNFAGKNLSPADTDKLVAAMREATPSLNVERFMAGVDKARPRSRRRGETVEDRVNAKITDLADSLAGMARPRRAA